jgi:MFS family permease
MGLEPFKSEDDANDKPDASWGVSVKEAFSIPAFWQIAAIMLVMGVVAGGVANHCVAYLEDIGHSSQKATIAWSLVMLVMVFGKFSFGPAADRFGSKNAMAFSCLLFAVAIGLLSVAKTYPIALLFAVVWGFASGAPLVLNALLTGDYLGMKNFGAIYGILNIMANLGGSLGPAGAGFYFDSKGTYLPVFYLFAILMLVGAGIALSTKPVGHTMPGDEEIQTD